MSAPSSLRVLVGGGTGFVGRHLVRRLRERGHAVTVISRGRDRHVEDAAITTWDDIQGNGLPPCDAVVNLAGENILNFARRWTEDFKHKVYSSRVDTNRLLATAVNQSGTPPEVFVSASGVGFYPHYAGSAGPVYDEASASGDDYVANLAIDWEAAAQPASNKSRVVILRQGVVLGRDGGAVGQAWLPFYLGLGGPLGNGQQVFPWIHIEDDVNLFVHAIENKHVSGILNAVAPETCTNAEYTKAFASALGRWAVFPVPEILLRLGLGDERAVMLVEGQKVAPKRTLDSGFKFTHPTIDEAMRSIATSK